MRARSSMMTIEEEQGGRLSGLEFSDNDLSSSSSGLSPHWSTTRQEYPPLLHGSRCRHASVVVDNHDNNNNEVQSIIVLGGQIIIMEDSTITNSVILWDSWTKQWRDGPCLNQKRDCLAAVTCNEKVFAIGGYNDTSGHLNTIECIDVASLLVKNNTNSTNYHHHHWKTLSCCLSIAKSGCAAVVVQERYIVIMGGMNDNDGCFSSVEVLDTQRQNKIVTLLGLAMNSPRSVFGAAVVGNSIYVVGGINANFEQLDSVEVLSFNVDVDNNVVDASTLFGESSSWTLSRDLKLLMGRHGHAVAKIGNCIVVAGGWVIDRRMMNSVAVLDPNRNVVWHLPNMTSTRKYCSIAALSQDIVVVGGQERESLEVLALMQW